MKVMHSMMDELASVVTDAASVRAVDKIAGQVAAAAGSQAPDEKGAQSAWEKQRKTMLQVRRVFTFSSLFAAQTDACADVYQQLADLPVADGFQMLCNRFQMPAMNVRRRIELRPRSPKELN